MSLETFNLNLFKLINASENATDLSINVAIFIANDLLYIMLVIFLVLWFKGNFANKKQILKAFIFTSIAIAISQIISQLFYHPRPFVMEVGRTIIFHVPNGSFPSDHMLIFSTIAFSYFFSKQRIIGLGLIGLAWLVAWSRIYLGVHFPLDMLGAFFIALAINILGLTLWKNYSNILMQFILKIYYFLFKKIIDKGYIR
ncbi:phosphatase PAP2 family protein [Acinetobacter radioresistens]|uniref:phosphatase PAP2 family protein n=1 Tax=Acinetobacter radioresistens TaxID=40216 RepID=UPI0021CD5DFA|nr:phosphatase PAP2 family protein [Acinetobacter radioresistens]MCU4498990.1 phosphatase PAP2 family protein [Acinetobacter radioresistens]